MVHRVWITKHTHQRFSSHTVLFSGPIILLSHALLICHQLQKRAMLLQHCVVSMLVQDVKKQTNWVNDYLTHCSLQRCGCTQNSSNPVRTLRCGEERQTGSWSKDTRCKRQIFDVLLKSNEEKIHVATNSTHGLLKIQHRKCRKYTVLRSHLVWESWSIMNAAQKTMLGRAISDEANRKQAALCIPV